MCTNLRVFQEYLYRLTGMKRVNTAFEDSSDLKNWDKDSVIKGKLELYLEKLEREDTTIKRQEFNEILKLLRCEPIDDWFFDNVFGGEITSISSFKNKVNEFCIKSALQFGNFKYSFRFFGGVYSSNIIASELSGSEDREAIWKRLSKTKTNLETKYKSRVKDLPVPFEKIDDNKRHYVSEIHRDNSSDSEVIRQQAEVNSAIYLTSDFIDVYVATSMRTKRQFEDVAKAISKVFKEPILSPLNLRYFDPTASDANNRLAKGLIEALMLKRADATLYLAQATDSLGKDSELATTLLQGKPVIVLVPEINIENRIKLLNQNKQDDDFCKNEIEHLHSISLKYCNKDVHQETARDCLKVFSPSEFRELLIKDTGLIVEKIAEMEKAFFDDRANLLLTIHPLGLQVNLQTGVAHGVIVVRNEEDAAKMIYRSLTNSHKYELVWPEDITKDNVVKLKEKVTGSIVRCVTLDNFLTKAFWNHYLSLKKP